MSETQTTTEPEASPFPFLDVRRKRLEQLGERGPKLNPYASDIGDCDREQVLSILRWQMRGPIPPDAMSRIEIGSMIEREVIRELMGLGVEIRSTQVSTPITDRDGSKLAGARIDGVLHVPVVGDRVFADGVKHDRYVMEIKSVAKWRFDRINSFDDLWADRWDRRKFRQIILYAYQTGERYGVIILVDRESGRWKLLTFDFNDDRLLQEAESILKRLRDIRDRVRLYESAVEDGEPNDEALEAVLPDYCSDPADCALCWARECGACFPPSYRKGASIFRSEKIEAMLDNRDKLRDDKLAYDADDRRVKKFFNELGPGTYGIGDFAVIVTHKNDRRTVAIKRAGAEASS